MKRRDEERMAKKGMISDVEGNRCRGRTRLGWMGGIKRALGERNVSLEYGRQITLDKQKWESIVRSE